MFFLIMLIDDDSIKLSTIDINTENILWSLRPSELTLPKFDEFVKYGVPT
jgi:hypothetical protein